ncbi:hypothetical protein [Pseudomonas sp. FP2294]|uniref:hypothetical protein n=1 Tax=Pseudomonas sp. FP2294 TaxID=2954089 RepID=UPI0027344934|nr:hypothetical protein [Pseudomonas sp. FP2294]WLH55620.1 hypothetical protein PSH73_17010 [Pseudomonas sp. FP2294]
MPNQVEFSVHFTQLYNALSDAEQDLIDEFVFHFHKSGTKGFYGKVGPTDNVPHRDPDREKKIWYAKRHKLWHAHIGHPHWDACKNQMASYHTSNFVVHFQKFSETSIALVDYGSHDPMTQPKAQSLFKR